MGKTTFRLAIIALVLICVPKAGFADLFRVVMVDENGNGMVDFTPLASRIANDPGPGGLSNVITFTLPYRGTQGDVLVLDPGNIPLDSIRFNGNGTLVFYSDSGVDPSPVGDAVADTQSPPGSFYANQRTVVEMGPENNNSAHYTPLPGQPGFDASHPTYTFVSDFTSIPEPNPIAVLSGFAFIVALRWMRRNSLGC